MPEPVTLSILDPEQAASAVTYLLTVPGVREALAEKGLACRTWTLGELINVRHDLSQATDIWVDPTDRHWFSERIARLGAIAEARDRAPVAL